MHFLNEVSLNGKVVGYNFFCPGCDHHHVYYTDLPGYPTWEKTGTEFCPTFTPSLLNRRPDGRGGSEQERCHLFVRNGAIEYCPDCTHSLAGKTVPMVDLDALDETSP